MELAPSIEIYTDGAAGNELPALALASKLSSEPAATHRLRAPWPWSMWVPRGPVLAPTRWRPPMPGTTWPQIAIGAGRMGAAALLTVKRASGGHTRTIQILNPRIDPDFYDLVVVPAHDHLSGPNVIEVEGSLAAINDAWLARERIAHASLGRLASPRTVVLIGGPRRGVTLGRTEFQRLGETLRNWQASAGGSLVLIGSRRTPAAWVRQLLAVLPRADIRWFDASDGDNPYRGALAWGDQFIVTADSVNMVSEALGTGRPVFSLCGGVAAGKLGEFHRSQVESGRLRPLRAQPAAWSYPPLRELERILPLVRKMLSRVTG